MSRFHERGYALILTIFVIALMAIVLLSVARVQADLSPSLRSLQSEARREVLAHSFASRIAFTLLSEPVGPRSVVVGGPRDGNAVSGASSMGLDGEIRLDGRYYALGEDMFASVQDVGGLYNLNSADDSTLASLLQRAGVDERRARGMAAALSDYIDEDDAVRSDGAEAQAYRRVRLPEPSNRALTTVAGARDVLGWNVDLPTRFWADVTATRQNTSININTAPFDVLASLLGDERLARNVVARRESLEIRAIEDVEGMTGARTRADGAALATQVDHEFRVHIVEGPRRRGYEAELSLAAPGSGRPFFWRFERRVGPSELADADFVRATQLALATAMVTP